MLSPETVPRPESGLECLMSAVFVRQRSVKISRIEDNMDELVETLQVTLFFSALLSSLELSDTKSMSVRYESSSEPLHTSTKYLFVN